MQNNFSSSKHKSTGAKPSDVFLLWASTGLELEGLKAYGFDSPDGQKVESKFHGTASYSFEHLLCAKKQYSTAGSPETRSSGKGRVALHVIC